MWATRPTLFSKFFGKVPQIVQRGPRGLITEAIVVARRGVVEGDGGCVIQEERPEVVNAAARLGENIVSG
jgi:hypothetical protein